MAVAHPHRHPGQAGTAVVKHPEAAVMAVENAVLGPFAEQTVQLGKIAGQVVVLPDRQFGDAPAQRFDLPVKKAGLVVMIQEVELHPIPVDGAVNIHHKGFHAARVHGGHDL